MPGTTSFRGKRLLLRPDDFVFGSALSGPAIVRTQTKISDGRKLIKSCDMLIRSTGYVASPLQSAPIKY